MAAQVQSASADTPERVVVDETLEHVFTYYPKSDEVKINKIRALMTDDTLNEAVKARIRQNAVEDLERFLRTRERLNTWNWYLMYLFHFTQAAGILVTTVSTGYNFKECVGLAPARGHEGGQVLLAAATGRRPRSLSPTCPVPPTPCPCLTLAPLQARLAGHVPVGGGVADPHCGEAERGAQRLPPPADREDR